MKLSSSTLFGLLASAAAYPLTTRRSSCSTDGALVCNGSSQFAICDHGSTVWMSVADGTVCICSGNTCTIEAASQTGNATGNTSIPTAASPTPPPSASKSSVNSLPTGLTNAAVFPAPSIAISVSTSETVSPKPSTTAYTSSLPATPSSPTTTTTTATASPTSTSTGTAGQSYIKTFTGNGDTSNGWPAQSEWLSFEDMWATNLANVISKSCSAFGQTDNSATESDDIKSAIQSISSSSGVDSRFILAVVMQESNGCVRVPTTNNGVVNPGLMQSHDGSHSCAGVNPCPADEITGMIADGTTGTSSGDGLQQLLAQTGVSDVSMYYKAAVLYNSGSIPGNGLLQDATATPCYASDIANRLIGWSEGTSGCTV